MPNPSLPSRSTLIVECVNAACADLMPSPQRNPEGRREWTTECEPVAASNMDGWCWWPVSGSSALRCPECGEVGRMWSY